MPMKIEQVKKTQDLRKKGLSYREIAKILKADVKTVFRWANYTLPEKTKVIPK